MLNSWYENLDEESFIIFVVDQIVSLELFWPLPLISCSHADDYYWLVRILAQFLIKI